MSVETYRRLVAEGIIANVEYIEGEAVMGEYGLALSAAQLAAAAKLGISLEPSGESADASVRAVFTSAPRPGTTGG